MSIDDSNGGPSGGPIFAFLFFTVAAFCIGVVVGWGRVSSEDERLNKVVAQTSCAFYHDCGDLKKLLRGVKQ